jgi:uroporphyrinogen-III synthase
MEHLLTVANELHLASQVLSTLRSDVVIGSIGPVMSGELRRHDLVPDVIPASPRMGALVLAAAEHAHAALAKKRQPEHQNHTTTRR